MKEMNVRDFEDECRKGTKRMNDSMKMEETNMETNKVKETESVKSWIERECEVFQQRKEANRLPSLKLEEGKICEFSIDFDKPFEEWVDPQTSKVKKIIPVKHNGEFKNFWLNVQNPLYHELLEAGKTGQKDFKVLQVGKQENTKYILVK